MDRFIHLGAISSSSRSPRPRAALEEKKVEDALKQLTKLEKLLKT
jgi:hypothetical protein